MARLPCDAGNSYSMNFFFGISDCLRSFGYHLPTQIQSILVKRSQHNVRAGQRLQASQCLYLQPRRIHPLSVESVKMNHNAHSSSSMHTIRPSIALEEKLRTPAQQCSGRASASCCRHLLELEQPATLIPLLSQACTHIDKACMFYCKQQLDYKRTGFQ